MNDSIMGHELQARDRQGILEENARLKSQLNTIEADFANCAKGISPCFYCINDDNCTGTTEKCNFKWKSRN